MSKSSDIPDSALESCAKEPIHIPGAIQPHGLLFALHSESLVVEQVSGNLVEILGLQPDSVLGRPFLEFVDPTSTGEVTRLIRDAAFSYVNPFRVPMNTPSGRILFDAIVQTLSESITILELESELSTEREDTPAHGLDNYLQMIQRSLAGISGLNNEEEITSLMAREIRRFTGFDRVMIYRFAPDLHGQVVAESAADGMESFLGLHYPASDIPAQARELYLKSPVRLLENVDATPAPMVPLLHPRTAAPLDMSRSVLRSMSPIHLQYLRNMGVAATLTMSLIIKGRLWGLIACHHRTPRFVTYSIRATASLYSVVMSAQLDLKQRNLEAENAAATRVAALRIITTFKDYSDLTGSLGQALPEFIDLFSGDGAAVLSEREIITHGSVPDESILQAAIPEFQALESAGPILTHHTAVDFPAFATALPKAAGAVAINLGQSTWLLIFRDEFVHTISWAGDPADAKTVDPAGHLSPRHSFKEWKETVRNQSKPWGSGVPILTREIRAGIVELVRKQNEILERSNHELRRFAGVMAHEIRNQLQPGVMALSLVKDDNNLDLNPGLAQLVGMGITSLTDLTAFIGEMLEFARTEIHSDPEDINLQALAVQVAEQMKAVDRMEATDIVVGNLPAIRGLKNQLVHLLTNLVRNALIHARNGSKPLEIRIDSEERENGTIVAFVRDNGRGIAPEEIDKIFDYFYRSKESAGGSGIGLAFCNQIVQRHGHKLWVEPTPGGGASFCFTVTPLE